MKRLAQLKSEAAALAQPPSTAAPAAAPAKPAGPSTAKPNPKEVKPEPTLVDQIMGDPIYQAGAAAVLIVLAGLGFMLYRRKKKPYDDNLSDLSEDVGSTTGKFATPVVPSPDTGDFTRTTVTQAVATAQSDSVDPISEADLFLNFGRDVQAEEILKEALQNTPNNHQIHLKLLGIYANRKDVNSFSTISRQLKDSGDEEAWQQAVEMGRKMEPDNPMYGGFKSMEDTGSATVQMKAFEMPQPEEAQPTQASALDFDFDVGAQTTKVASSPEQDFLGIGDEAMITPASEQETAMDFDITSTNPAMAAPEAKKTADDGGMAFTLDFPVEDAKPAPAASSAGIGLAGISLNFDDALSAPGEPAAAGKDDHWQEVATKLDLAKAYQEMGDNDGAREILEEVTREGDAAQREAAQALFEQLG
jgi:pilus assembly protein FimV